MKRLPVLLWIHGGGYAFGAGTDPMWGKSYPRQDSYEEFTEAAVVH